jgi:AmmeMemoRadiSam system protein B
MRKSYFNGSFYSDSCNELSSYFSENINNIANKDNIRALIVPHAGYFYSGNVAKDVYKITNGENYKRIVVIGPSHHIYFKNVSLTLEDEYQTPCGNLEIDVNYSYELIKKFSFLSYIKQAYKEHSTEVQMPFIKHYFNDVKVIEIVYGDIEYRSFLQLIELILKDKDNLVVISTDLSHFHNLDDANKLDTYCIKAFEELDIAQIDNCEACGKLGLKAIIEISKKQNLKSELINYKTSADVNNDKSRVVGYMSGILTE